MYKSLTTVTILGLAATPAFAAIGDGSLLQQAQATDLNLNRDGATLNLNRDGTALNRDGTALDLDLTDRDVNIMDMIDAELDLDLEMPDMDPAAMQERVETGKEIRSCADTLDVSGASTAIQQYINNMAGVTDSFSLDSVLADMDIDTTEAAGTMFALYKVWSEETEKETEERRDARRESKVDEYITEECQVAFESMAANTGLMAGEDSSSAVEEEEANCYQFNDGEISVELCMNDATNSAIEGEDYVTVSGLLTNKGTVGLCNITFDIMDLESAVATTPTTLPKVAGVFEPAEEFSFSATIPVDPESHVAPYVDVWNTFYACTEEDLVEDEEVEDEVTEEVEEVEREPVVADPESAIDLEEWITPETMCFYSCYDALIKKFGSESALTECPTLEFLLTNEASCHKCDPFVVQATKEKCVDFGCSEAQCAVKTQTKTSGASKTTVSVAFAAAAAGVLAFMN